MATRAERVIALIYGTFLTAGGLPHGGDSVNFPVSVPQHRFLLDTRRTIDREPTCAEPNPPQRQFDDVQILGRRDSPGVVDVVEKLALGGIQTVDGSIWGMLIQSKLTLRTDTFDCANSVYDTEKPKHSVIDRFTDDRV